MKRYLFTIVLAMVFPLHGLLAQSPWNVSGIIKNEQGTPIQNVTVTSVLPKGYVTKTDENGYFSMAVPGDSVRVELRSVGYMLKRVLFSPKQPSLHIILSRDEMLIEEVVVNSGYQTQKLETKVGSYEVIGKELLNREVGPDFMSRLENNSSGILFDRQEESFATSGRMPNNNVYIHGVSTLRTANLGGSAPLIVVDNFPFEGDVNLINPAEIESVTVLKDAAASSIWGAKAGNGVIVITTKKGSYGEQLRQQFDVTTRVMDKPAFFKRNIIDNATLIEVERWLYDKGYFANRANSASKPVLSPVVELLLQRDGEELNDQELEQALQRYASQDVRNDMLEHVYRNVFFQQYNYNLNGGSNSVNYNLQLGYDRSLPVQRSDEMQRITASISNNFKVAPFLEVYAGLNVAEIQSTSAPGGDFYRNNGYPFPYVNLVDEQGNMLPVPYQYRQTFVDTAGQGMLLDWTFNPLELVYNPPTTSNQKNIRTDLRTNIDLLRNLKLNLQYRNSFTQTKTDDHHGLDSYYARNLVNRGSQIVNGNVAYNFPYGGILRQRNARNTAHYFRSQMNYSWINHGHELATTIGSEVQLQRSYSMGNVLYGYDENNLTFATSLDFTRRYPVFGGLASSDIIPFNQINNTSISNNFLSFYAIADYHYEKRYLLSASVRRDASNLFGVATNKKWTPLWSIGAGWNVHHENFWNTKHIDVLKLRGSFGYSGNVDNSMSALTTLQLMSPSTEWGVPYNVGRIVGLPNELLRWEKLANWNVGVDIAFAQRRWSLTADYYVKHTYDLFDTFQLDPSVGASSMVLNGANTRSRGVDLRLNGTVGRRLLRWNTNLLFTYNNNWVVKTLTDPKLPNSYVTPGGVSNLEEDMVYELYAYRWSGLNAEGMPQGILNGEVSTAYRDIMRNSNLDEMDKMGSSRPLLFGVWRNTFSHGHFALSASLAYRFKYFFRMPSIDYDGLFERNEGHSDFYDRWQQPGDETKTHVPAMIYPLDLNANSFYSNASVLVERGDYIRLQDLRLDFRTELKMGQKQLPINCFAMVNNVGLIWKATKKDIDPEFRGNIPTPTSYSFGLNVKL